MQVVITPFAIIAIMKITKTQEDLPLISFESKVFKIDSSFILQLPKSVSINLPSRGIVMVEGIINGYGFKTALEPDGKGSHWFYVDEKMLKATHINKGDTVRLSIRPIKEWPEPQIPKDLESALNANTQVNSLWMDITPMARWDWIRWIRSTKNPQTRAKRIEVAFSKLKAGSKRPCCFNRTMCTDPNLSKNGVLLGLA